MGREEEQHEDDLWKAEQSYEVRWFMYFTAVLVDVVNVVIVNNVTSEVHAIKCLNFCNIRKESTSIVKNPGF